MADEVITGLLRQAPFSFVGTIEHLHAATMGDLTIDDRTSVVQVEQVLHAPPAFAGLEGQRITLQLAADAEPPAVGDSAAFFVQGLAFGESIAVAEVGRMTLDEVEAQMDPAAEARGAAPFAALEQRMRDAAVRERSSLAQAVVVGRVVKLERAVPMGTSEHDPDWWKATIDVHHVEQGDVAPGEVGVLYANSLDVRWRNAPKPKAAQEGVWFLHATEGDLAAVAPFEILDPDDLQPVQRLDALREDG